MSSKPTKIEFYRMKAEIAELKLEKAEQEHEKEIQRMDAILNEFASRFSVQKSMGGTYNARIVLNDILEKLDKKEIPIAVWENGKINA